MKRSNKIAVVSFAASAIALIGGLYGLFNLNPCDNEILSESLSPDRSKKLIVFHRDCGATTGVGTHASIVSFNARLKNEAGNVFVADTDWGTAPSTSAGGPELRSSWIAPHRLLLQHHVSARVFTAETLTDGVEIRYETFE